MYTRENLVVSLVLAISMVGVSYGAGGVLPGDGLSEPTAYLIEDLADFDVFADPCNSAIYWASDVYTKLACDLDLAGRAYTTAVIAPDTDSTDWQFSGIPFEGIFDGDGHIVRNLTIDTEGIDNDCLGLFGMICDSVGNLGIENINITAGTLSWYLGGLCGYNESDITNCYADGAIISGKSYLGGLCGWNTSGTITNCRAAVSVTGNDKSYALGGLCGYNAYGTITNCYATGSVTGYYWLGGLCGYNAYGTDPAYGIITNCYATGSVTGMVGSDYLGGLCGYNNSGTIANCYATGAVTSDGYYVGGFCGVNYNIVTNCFWDAETGGPDNDIGTPKTTAEMMVRSTFTDAGWDFVGEKDNGTDNFWHMRADGMGYPKLSWRFLAGGANQGKRI